MKFDFPKVKHMLPPRLTMEIATHEEMIVFDKCSKKYFRVTKTGPDEFTLETKSLGKFEFVMRSQFHRIMYLLGCLNTPIE